MKSRRRCILNRWLAILGATGFLCQLGSCEIGEITTTSTIDGRELIISLIRDAILAPLDEFVTEAVNDAFSDDDN